MTIFSSEFASIRYDVLPVRKLFEYLRGEMDLDATDFKVLLSNFSGMIYQFELGDCRPVFISDGCYQITGYTKDSFLNKDGILYQDLILEEYAEYVNESVTTAVSLNQG